MAETQNSTQGELALSQSFVSDADGKYQERRIATRRQNRKASRAVYKLYIYFRATRIPREPSRFIRLGLSQETVGDLLQFTIDRRQRRGRR